MLINRVIVNDWCKMIHALDLNEKSGNTPRGVRPVDEDKDGLLLAPGGTAGFEPLPARCAWQLQKRPFRRLRNKLWQPRVPGHRAEARSRVTLRIFRIAARHFLHVTAFGLWVAMPSTSARWAASEWHDWQVIDAALFRQRPLTVSIENVLKSARSFLSTCPSARWFSAGAPRLTAKDAAHIAQILRPSFELLESPRVRQGRWDEEVRRYTEEQFGALDAMQANPRVLFTGPAGTGKTVLAVESVRRAHAAGQRCLFLCFNRLLGRWLQERLSPLNPGVTTSTFHSLLLSVSGSPLPGEGAAAAFWEQELPEVAIRTLIERDPPVEPFDTVVIDEAQDLLRPNYLDIFDLLLRGGLSAGRWRLFADPEKQSIYTSGVGDPLAMLQQRAGNVPVFSLRVNCRNSPRIATLVHLLGGLNPDYSRVLRPDNGIEPQLKYFRNFAEQETLFMETLGSWYAEGIKGNDTVVLSPRADRACLAAQIAKEPWRSRLRQYGESSRRHVPYASIHAFKGLEASAVLITDIEHVAGDAANDLFYVAVTRALHRLAILAHESARLDVIGALTGLRTVPAASLSGH